MTNNQTPTTEEGLPDDWFCKLSHEKNPSPFCSNCGMYLWSKNPETELDGYELRRFLAKSYNKKNEDRLEALEKENETLNLVNRNFSREFKRVFNLLTERSGQLNQANDERARIEDMKQEITSLTKTLRKVENDIIYFGTQLFERQSSLHNEMDKTVDVIREKLAGQQ